MDKVNHEVIQVIENPHITRVQNCKNNTDIRSGGYELVSLSGEYGKHLATISSNIVNTNMIPRISSICFNFNTDIQYVFSFFDILNSILQFSNSDCKCRCECKSDRNEKFICVCLSNSLQKINTSCCCICICKHNDNTCCKCICICICNKNGDDCGCESGRAHTCSKPLFKINVSSLDCQSSDIIDKLFYIQCCISRLENKCCPCWCCKDGPCEKSCCESCLLDSSSGCCSCVCCLDECKPESCQSYCCCREGPINYLSIIMKIYSVESLFKEVGEKIPQLRTLKNILILLMIIGKSCKKCNESCCSRIESLIKKIQRASEYYSLCPTIIKHIRSFVEYKLFYPKYNEIIEKLNNSVLQLLKNICQKNNCISNSTTNNTSPAQVNNAIMNLMSMIVIDESIFVLSRLYSHCKIKSEIDGTLRILEGCVCLRIYNRDWRDKIETFDKPFPNINTRYYSPIIVSLIMTHVLNYGNYMCLCLVVRYILLNDLYVLKEYNEYLYMDLLSSMTRSYKKYSYSIINTFNLSKLMVLMITTLDKILTWMISKYTEYDNDLNYTKRCLCKNYEDPYYSYLISIILFLSSLIENMWSMDTETLRLSIEKLSILYSHLETYDFSPINDIKGTNCLRIYSLLINKECEGECPSNEDEKCCCCWCVAFYNLAIILIYMCLQFKLHKPITTKDKCKEWKEFCQIVECDSNCRCRSQNGQSGSCCLLNLALSSQLCNIEGSTSSCKELQKALEKCCETCGVNGCCKTLQEKVKTGLCKLLLLGCECTCTTDSSGNQVKVKCVFFNDLNKRTRVALVVFCKCSKPSDKCCCLYQLIDNLKTKLNDKFCKDNNCICDELKTICNEICGADCGDQTPCKELPKKLAEICNGGTGNYGSDCLCKQITTKIGDCLKKCSQGKCECATKDGCCRCVCCKVLGASLRILTRACRANVLEPYNRITIDLLNCSKNKKEPTKSILERINNGTLNILYLVKNNLTSITNVSNDTGLTDVTSGRNWGYESIYEHHVSNNRISDGYHNLLGCYIKCTIIYIKLFLDSLCCNQNFS